MYVHLRTVNANSVMLPNITLYQNKAGLITNIDKEKPAI